LTSTSKELEAPKAAALLRKIPMFATLDQQLLDDIVRSSATSNFAAGSTIAKQGDEGSSLYLILNGRVEVRRGPRVLSKLNQGQFFGEMSILDGQPRSADVTAIESTECLVLERSKFEELVRAHPELALEILKEVVGRLRETSKSVHHSFF
jgi:CRP/FNR family transcriptional regulator, cyclic AMP receptor protein